MSTEKLLVFAKKMMHPRSNDGRGSVIRQRNLGSAADSSNEFKQATQGSRAYNPYPKAVGGKGTRTVALTMSMTNGAILPPEALLEEPQKPVVRTRVVVRVSKKPDPSEVIALRQVGKDKVEAVDGSGAKKKPSDLPKEIVVDLSKTYGQVKSTPVTQEDLDLATHLHVLSMIPQGLRDAHGNPTGLAKSLHAAGVLTKREAFAKAQRILKGLV